MQLKIFEQAFQLLNKLEDHGHQAFLVGGCVRNYLQNIQIADFDIATSAKIEEIKKIFPKTVSVNREHDTVIVVFHNQSYEITTFRNMQHVNDNNTFDIFTDLKYRDFTMNAIAMDKVGNIIDPNKGKEDLASGVIRAVGSPSERYSEDPLRMLRAIRFASELGFTIENNTLNAIAENKIKLHAIATERIANEMKKMIMGKFVQQSIDYLLETKLIYSMPIFKQHPKLTSYLPKPMPRLTSFADFITIFYFQYEEVSIANWIRAWKCSNVERKSATKLYTLLREMEKKGFNLWTVYQLDPPLDKSFIVLSSLLLEKEISKQLLQSVRDGLQIQSRQDLQIDGRDLIALFPERQAGAWIEQLLHTIEKKVVMNQLKNEHETIKEWIRCHPQEIN